MVSGRWAKKGYRGIKLSPTHYKNRKTRAHKSHYKTSRPRINKGVKEAKLPMYRVSFRLGTVGITMDTPAKNAEYARRHAKRTFPYAIIRGVRKMGR